MATQVSKNVDSRATRSETQVRPLVTTGISNDLDLSRFDGPLGQLPLVPLPSRAVTRTQGDGDVPEVDPNMELPLHETSVEAMFRPPEITDFTLPPTLGEQVKGKPLIAKTMPRQSEINNLMKHLNRKILSKTRFPSSLKDLEAAYCSSEAFKDIYQFLRFNKLPTSRRLAKRIEASAQDYYVLGSILFKYIPQKSGEIDAVMCIPPSKLDFILDMYHGTLIGGHQGMNKTMRTLSPGSIVPKWLTT